MGLETGVTHIDDLVAANPVGTTDTIAEADNHIRNIKTALLNTFPALDAPVTADPTELNYLDGSTPGTVVASKAVVVDGSKDIDFDTGDISATNITATGTLTATNGIDEFSTDGTLAGNSDTAVPTEKAVKTYVDSTPTKQTWTPVVTPQSGTITTQSGDGQYLQIGDYVFVSGSVSVTDWGTGSGNIRIATLPVAPNVTTGGGVTPYDISCPVVIHDSSYTYPSGSHVFMYCIDGDTTGYLASVTGSTLTFVNKTQLGTATHFAFSISYPAN